MKLSVAERIILPGLLPEQGSMVKMLLAKHIREKIEFTSGEIGSLNLKGEEQEDGSTHFKWDPQKAIDVEFCFEKSEIDFLKEQVDRLDTEGNITSSNLDLCLKIKEFDTIAI
jgi:hypothetical protein